MPKTLPWSYAATGKELKNSDLGTFECSGIVEPSALKY